VSWFDTAPSYGAGESERILGEFLSERRTGVGIGTKVGFAPAPVSLLARMSLPVARFLIRRVPGSRQYIVGLRHAQRRLLISGALIRASVHASLERLRTDHIDLLSLHEPTEEEMQREDVRKALDDLAREGLVGAIGVAGSAEHVRAARSAGFVFDVAQVHCWHAPIGDLASAGQRPALITYGVFERADGPPRARQIRERHADLWPAFERLATAIRGAGVETVAVLACALASNPQGVVLASMLSDDHARLNAQIVAALATDDVMSELSSRERT
jgi:hypothetical protein